METSLFMLLPLVGFGLFYLLGSFKHNPTDVSVLNAK